MTEPKLLPCPLCGGKLFTQHWEDTDQHEVDCKGCHLQTIFETRDDAIEFWNIRTISPALARIAAEEIGRECTMGADEVYQVPESEIIKAAAIIERVMKGE